MLKKFSKDPWQWVPALALHCWIHGFLTMLICVVVAGKPHLMWLGLLDFTVHFAVDRVKASPGLLGRYKPDSRYFWWSLGADQACHHLTHYFLIYQILTR